MPQLWLATFGCQMNVHDSERALAVLAAAGYEPAARPEEADVLLLMSCSVRARAEHKLRSLVGRLAPLKRRTPAPLIVVAGCLAQQEGEGLLQAMPALDLVVGPDHLAELPALLRELEMGAPPLVLTGFDLDEPRFLPPLAAAASGPGAYVTTAKGCNERCAFCVVPQARGPERCRPSADIVAEIEALVAGGVREVTLLGQTVNGYVDPRAELALAPGAARDDPGERQLAALLWRIAERAPALARLRYVAPHPRYVTPALVRAHRDLPVLARHVHLPVQSGADLVLARMNRRHGRADYLERTARLAGAAPGITFSTDIIVGFPGETEEDFAQTLALVREVGFVSLFGFKYSPRPGTPALDLGDDVPAAVKAERLARLFALSEEQQGRHLGSLVGTVQSVLVEGPAGRPELPTGRTERNEIVHVAQADGLDLVGRLVEIEIVEAHRHSLRGVPTEQARRRFAREPSADAGARPAPAAAVVGEAG